MQEDLLLLVLQNQQLTLKLIASTLLSGENQQKVIKYTDELGNIIRTLGKSNEQEENI